MPRILLLIMFLPSLVFSQEKVSDIKYFGSFVQANIEGKIGFTEINGVQYLLQENDSLLIYRFENDQFVPYSSIKVGYEKNVNVLINPNRSHFEFRDGFYYRFYSNGLQVIDIENSRVIVDYQITPAGQIFIPFELTNERLYFKTNQFETLPNSYFEFNSKSIHPIPRPQMRTNYSQMGHLIPGLENGRDIYIYNVLTDKDSLIYSVTSGIFNMILSRADTSFVFIEENGNVLKIDNKLQFTDTKCNVDNLSNILNYSVHGDKLIAVYDDGIDNSQDLVIVKDIVDDKVEMSFLTKVRETFMSKLSFISNEYHNKNFFIFGYWGAPNVPDSPIQGLYYLLDLVNNQAIPIENVSLIKSYTPILFKSVVYFVAIQDNGWSYKEDLIKVNLSNLENFEYNPSYDKAEKIVLGYTNEEAIIFSLHSLFKKDSTQVIRLKEDNQSVSLNNISFLHNVGVSSINNVISSDKNLIFSNEVGVYSLDNDARIVLEIEKITRFSQGSPVKRQIAHYKNKIALFIMDQINPMYIIIDLDTDKIDTIKVAEGSFAQSGVLALGPLLLYNSYTYLSHLHIYDLRSNTLDISKDNAHLVWRIHDVKSSALSAITVQSSAFIKTTPYKLNFETKEILKLNIEFDQNVQVYYGGDNSFYFINYFNNSDSFDIHLLDKNDEFTILYKGLRKKNRFVDFLKSPNRSISFMSVQINDFESILITNDLANTKVQKINNSRTLQDSKAYNDIFFITTYSEQKNKYWIYKAFEDLIEIEDTQNSKLLFNDVNDSLVVITFRNATKTSFIKYDYKNNIESVIEVQNGFGGECDLNLFNKYFPLNKTQYLLSTSCTQGDEPYILDIHNGTLELLADIIPGPTSSGPRDFIKFKD